eukprot:1476573-Pyramimonas_sp.AAC.1
MHHMPCTRSTDYYTEPTRRAPCQGPPTYAAAHHWPQSSFRLLQLWTQWTLGIATAQAQKLDSGGTSGC